MKTTSLLNYYSRRAQEYERVYEKPERQEDLLRLAESLRQTVSGHDVLEVACGTGYWTERYAAAAHSVLATDASATVLALAKGKPYPPGRVRFALADVYALLASENVAAPSWTAAVAAFWWSHVPTARLPAFLSSLHASLEPGAVVWMCDNRYVEGSSTPIAHTDVDGDTYQRRPLSDGSTHTVLKNFPSASELRSAVAGDASQVDVIELEYYWMLRYVLHEETYPDGQRP
ncbi:MAG: class I SAM-dependent methyltransferase [Bacteroidota bacterium]